MSEEEEIASDVDRLVRAAVMGGAQVAERFAGARADRDRRAAEQSREEARRAKRLHVTHRDMARVVHRQVADSQFWEKATPERIGLTYAAAYEWQGADPAAQASMLQLREGLRERHGVDVDQVLAGRLDDLDDAQRQVAQQVIGRYLDPATVEQLQVASPGVRPGTTEAVAQAAADQEREKADEARAADARTVAAELERDGARQDAQIAPGAGHDERDAAASRQADVAVYERRPQLENHGAAAAGYDDQESLPAGGPVLTTRYQQGQAPDASVAADAARQQVARTFPTPAIEAIKSATARARVVRAPAAHDRTHDLGR